MGLQRNLSLEVKGNKYALSFPTVAQFIDIETTKARLSSDVYGDMVKSRTMAASRALDYIDMTANLTILAPGLMKDLKADSILSLDVFDAKELMTAYKDQFVPWLVEWQRVLATVDPKEKAIEEEDEVIESDLDQPQ